MTEAGKTVGLKEVREWYELEAELAKVKAELRDWREGYRRFPGSERFVEAAEAECARLREAAMDLLAHLVAAHSLLSRSPKTAAPSNKMFDQMLADYQASIDRARIALASPPAKEDDNAGR